MYDVIVVGAGPIGAATAHHLSEAGAEVLLVGPEEPARFDDHQGVWAGHYDQGRLAHVLEVPLVAALLAARSMRRFAALTQRTGVDFARPIASLAVSPDVITDPESAEWFDQDRLASNAADLAVEVDRLDAAGLRARFPHLVFEPGHVGLVQPDAFIVNPRELVRAFVALAAANGARILRDTVVSVRPESGGCRVLTTSGQSLEGRSVVIATGAATNATALLGRRLAMDTFGATVVLVETRATDELDLPATMYLKVRDGDRRYGGIVMPPLRYPDGRWYVKCAGSSVLDHPLTTAEEIAAWVRTGGVRSDIDEALGLLADLVPGRTWGQAHTRPCLVSSNRTGHPYVDQVEENLFVAVEGERGVMAADEIGRLTSQLVRTGVWADNIPHEMLRAVWDVPVGAVS